MASTSSTVPTLPQDGPGKHDVFVCFRGKDTRYNFVSFLHRELVDRNGIETYIDYRLDGGEEIEPALLKKIEESLISLVIFSRNFADSTFCLREISKILECKETKSQIVIPVFYQVDPTDIQELQGSFADALAKHEGECKAEEVESWRNALKEIANLRGWDSNEHKPDTKLLDEIVAEVQKKLHQMPSPSTDSGRLVGIGSRIDEVKSLLRIGSPDLLVVGLWGMPGIGKTTIAAKVYGQISTEFEGSCFLRNVREDSDKYGLVHLLQKIVGEVLKIKDLKLHSSEELPANVIRTLRRKKVLIVLDDVSNCELTDVLAKEDDLLGQGSRIILTSRDKQVVENQFCARRTYKVRELDDREASQLFKLHAFKVNDQCGERFEELSQRAVMYTKGNPLALKVLGSNLYNKGLKIWESTLANLKGISSLDLKIRKILMTSYDGLKWNQKMIFLDIACFFGRYNKGFVQYTLDQCGFNAGEGIERLIDMCLLNISEDKEIIWMHDLLQQLGQDIVFQENPNDPRKRSRLWIPEDIDHVLTNYQGTETVQAISLDMSKIQEIKLSPTVFQEMCNLRLLKFYLPRFRDDIIVAKGGSKLLFPEGVEFLPKRLRFLCWDCCPLKSMPLKFCPTNLVQLQMSHSIDFELWNEVSPLVNLKVLEVTWPQKLTTINPVLQKAPNLEVLNLIHCKLLRTLDLSKVPNLKVLDLSYCESLDEVPSSIINCTKLNRLYLSGCIRLRTLCSEIGHLSQLIELNMSYCERLESLPSSIGQLKCLEELNLSACSNLAMLPDTINSLVSSRRLILKHCEMLQCLPNLPPSLKYLDASECSSLESVASIFTQAKNDEYEAAFEDFNFENCMNLSEDACLKIIEDAKLRIQRMATSLCKQEYSGEPIGFRLSVPGSTLTRFPEWFSHQSQAGRLSVKTKELPHSDSPIEEEFLGFAFCTVVPDLFRHSGFECDCCLKTESGTLDLHFSPKQRNLLFPPEEELRHLPHLLIWYDWRIEYSNSSIHEASFNFYDPNTGFIAIHSGVHLLYAQPRRN